MTGESKGHVPHKSGSLMETTTKMAPSPPAKSSRTLHCNLSSTNAHSLRFTIASEKCRTSSFPLERRANAEEWSKSVRPQMILAASIHTTLLPHSLTAVLIAADFFHLSLSRISHRGSIHQSDFPDPPFSQITQLSNFHPDC